MENYLRSLRVYAFGPQEWADFPHARKFIAPDPAERAPLIAQLVWEGDVTFSLISGMSGVATAVKVDAVTVTADAATIQILLHLDEDSYLSFSRTQTLTPKTARAALDKIVRLLQEGELPFGFLHDGDR
jgi:hypothetical protein